MISTVKNVMGIKNIDASDISKISSDRIRIKLEFSMTHSHFSRTVPVKIWLTVPLKFLVANDIKFYKSNF